MTSIYLNIISKQFKRNLNLQIFHSISSQIIVKYKIDKLSNTKKYNPL